LLLRYKNSRDSYSITNPVQMYHIYKINYKTYKNVLQINYNLSQIHKSTRNPPQSTICPPDPPEIHQIHQKSTRSIRNPPDPPEIHQIHQKSTRSTRNPPDPSEIHQIHQKSTRSTRNPPEVHYNPPEIHRIHWIYL